MKRFLDDFWYEYKYTILIVAFTVLAVNYAIFEVLYLGLWVVFFLVFLYALFSGQGSDDINGNLDIDED